MKTTVAPCEYLVIMMTDENTQPELTPRGSAPEQPEVSWRLSRNGLEKVDAKLRRLRQEQRMPLDTAANALGTPKNRLNKIERGTYVQFSLTHLKRMCKLYGVTAEALLPRICISGMMTTQSHRGQVLYFSC